MQFMQNCFAVLFISIIISSQFIKQLIIFLCFAVFLVHLEVTQVNIYARTTGFAMCIPQTSPQKNDYHHYHFQHLKVMLS